MFSERNKNGDSLSPADQYYKQCPLQNALYIDNYVYMCKCITYMSPYTCRERDLSKHLFTYVYILYVCMCVCVYIKRERYWDKYAESIYIYM